MRLHPLLVFVALGLAGCDDDLTPNSTDGETDTGAENGTDTGETTDTGSESGTDTGDTGDTGDNAACEQPILCDGWANQGGEEPAVPMCFYEVLRDANQPGHLQVRGENDEPTETTVTDYEFVIDGTSRSVTRVLTRRDGDQVISRRTEICELKPSTFFDGCLSYGCWPAEWTTDCVPAADCW
jgi:hypothetical protein